MQLHARRWGFAEAEPVLCIHGVCQHGGIFEPLGVRMAQGNRQVIAVDLRGHGQSTREPPWSATQHVDDLVETADALGVETATWVGHSFGGRLAAAVAARAPERVDRLVLIDPGLEVATDHALRRAEIDRLDWSFATIDGAVAALLSIDDVIATPHETAMAYARDDLQRGPDGRLRFSFCPSAVVVAWSEMAEPSPVIADVPTLLLHTETALRKGPRFERAYRDALGPLLTVATVPNGHNVMWESPQETITTIERFVGSALERAASAPSS
jgi:lipase